MTLGAFGSIVLSLVLLVPNAAAKDRPGPPYAYALRGVDARLRFAIEEAPAVLIARLASSKSVCSEALEAEQSGDGDSAQLGWASLSETVQKEDSPIERAIVNSFARSRSDLGNLRATFSERWRGRLAELGALALGASETRDGVRHLQAVVQRFEVAFGHWERHDCVGAQQSVTSTDRAIPSALAKINVGMALLRTLQ